MEVPIEISFDSDKPKKRAPPARFAAMMKQREEKEQVDPPNPTKEVITNNMDCIVRAIRNPLCKDNAKSYSLEEAVPVLAELYPEFNAKKEIIDTEPKWQEKVKALEEIVQFIKDNAKNKFEYSEAAIVYGLSFSKEFKAANINFVKGSIDCIKGVMETCGIGPRMAERVIVGLIPKIQDRKFGAEVSDLIMLIGEYVGPNIILSAVSKGMEKSKIPLQQKAALTLFARVVNEFGAFSLDVKQLFGYLQTDKAILNTHNEVKDQTIVVLCALHQQIGPVILQLLENSGINALLLKSIKESFEKSPFDPSLRSRYATTPEKPVSTATTKAAEPVFKVEDLITAADVSADLPPMIKLLNMTEGKDSWKSRQQGLNDVIALLKQKQRIVNSRAVSDLVSVLKVRLTESHLMLKAKVLNCIAQLAEALGDEIFQYNPTIMSDLIKMTSESNKTVVEQLYNTLSMWVNHSEKSVAQAFNALCSYLPAGLKNPGGRKAFLHWLNQFIHHGERRGLMLLLPGCVDSMLDKIKDVRSEAATALKVIGSKCGRVAIEGEINNRKQSDKLSLKTALQSILDALPENGDPSAPQAVTTPAVNTLTPADSAKEEKPKITEARMQSLANRPGARVLGKRTTSSAAVMKQQAVSSIPKPQPPLKKRAKQGELLEKPVLEVEMEEETPVESCTISEVVQPAQSAQPVQPVQHEVLLEPVLPTPSMSCLAIHPLLTKSDSHLLTQKELSQCTATSLRFSIPSLSFISSVLSSFSNLQSALSRNPNLLVLAEQINSEYNAFIESSAQICWVLNHNLPILNSPEFQTFSQNVSLKAAEEVNLFYDSLLRLLSTIVSQLTMGIHHGMQLDTQLMIHIVNVYTCLLEEAQNASTILASTISLLLMSVIHCIFTIPDDIQFNEDLSLKSVFRKLLRLSIDKLPLPELLHGFCLFAQAVNTSLDGMDGESMLLVLIKRFFSLLMTRVNTSAMTDRVKMDCVEKMKGCNPEQLHPALRSEIDRCIHVLEPVQVTSTSYGEVLKSVSQMLSSQSTNNNLSTATALKNQIASFKQRFKGDQE